MAKPERYARAHVCTMHTFTRTRRLVQMKQTSVSGPEIIVNTGTDVCFLLKQTSGLVPEKWNPKQTSGILETDVWIGYFHVNVPDSDVCFIISRRLILVILHCLAPVHIGLISG